jgi:hypothetical protein
VARLRRDDLQAELALAAGTSPQRLIVAQQNERMARLGARGSCMRDFECTLSVFIGTLQIFERTRARAA